MSRNGQYRVQLVGKSTADILRAAYSKLPGQVPPNVNHTAVAIFRAMQNRHVGITLQLAQDLARLLVIPGETARVFHNDGGSVWGRVVARLHRELSPAQDDQHSDASPLGLVLSSLPVYAAIRLAMPIISEACSRIGECLLFCEDELADSPDSTAYHSYAEHLSADIIEMAGDDGFDIFWLDRALVFANFSRRPAHWRQTAGGLPETNPSALGLLHRLRPELDGLKLPNHHPKKMMVPIRNRQIRRLKEEGIDGVRASNRLEDLDDILHSEFATHPIILADRLLNTGFLVYRRQPKREKLRHVLVVAVVPPGLGPPGVVDFIKAAWFDCMARLAHLLCRHRLYQTEIRYLEGDAFDRLRGCEFLLKDMLLCEVGPESMREEDFHHQFLASLGWMPPYLNDHDRFSALPKRARKAAGDDPQKHFLGWLRAARQALQESPRWAASGERSLANRRDNTLLFDEFAYVHVMTFLPASWRNKDRKGPNQLLGSLRLALELGNDQGRNAVITWVPETTCATPDWRVEGRRSPQANLFAGECGNYGPEKVSGRLVSRWLQLLIKEIWHA